MEQDLDSLKQQMAQAISKQGARFKSASLFVKVVLVVIFSAVATIAQFFGSPEDAPTNWQIVGIISTLVVAIGGIFTIITEQDAAVELALARNALDAASDAETRFDVILELEAHTERLIELYQAMNVLRGAIERLADLDNPNEDEIVAKLLKASERSLSIAIDFAQSDQWTLCVYKAVPSADEVNRAVLKCIAHKRAIECDPSEARVWKEGTGIMGVAYASGDEIVVPDLQADGMRAVFGTSANETRAYDNDRYRSMVAVPIKVNGIEKPWGVVTATTDRCLHFSPRHSDGTRPDEGVRALASMIALAIAVIRKKN